MDPYAPINNALANTQSTIAQNTQDQGVNNEKVKFAEVYDNVTIGKIGEQMGIDPYVWGYMNINKDAQTTPERFQQMLTNPQVLRALPRAAIVRHSEQLKTMEKQILTEQDPQKKEQIKSNYDALSGQIRILRDSLENGPPPALLTSVIKGMGITDPAEAANAMKTMTEKWKEIWQPNLSETSRPVESPDRATPNQAPLPANTVTARYPANIGEAFIRKYREFLPA